MCGQLSVRDTLETFEKLVLFWCPDMVNNLNKDTERPFTAPSLEEVLLILRRVSGPKDDVLALRTPKTGEVVLTYCKIVRNIVVRVLIAAPK